MTESNSKVIASAMQSKQRNKRLSLQEAIMDFRSVHGDRYDYSAFIYVKSSVKGKIICSEHGVFEQSHYNHFIKKAGCPKCAGRNKTIDGIKKTFTPMHGNRYDYSLIHSCKSHEKLTIICRVHGLFKMFFNQHKKGANCPKCAHIKQLRATRKLNTKDITEAFYRTHGFDRYDYSKVVYCGVDCHVLIKCNVCKLEFSQTPYNHRSGQGCPICNKATPYRKSKYVEVCERKGGLSNFYIVEMFLDDERFFKVGITRSTIKQRYLRCPYKFKEILCINGEAGLIWDLENKVHSMLKEFHYVPKVSFGGSRLECFSVMPEEILKNLCTGIA